LATVDGDHTAEALTFHPLAPDEVSGRVKAGESNVVDSDDSRSVASILRANIFTRFNAIISVLLVLILIFGKPADAMFGLVMIANALIGIVQELRAKRTLDKLQVLNTPTITVQRSGGYVEVASSDIVLGDMVVIARGEQIPVDGVVIASDGLEVSEALLTGESEPVLKTDGLDVMSGSFVVAGVGSIGATAVGADSYANRLAQDARRFTLATSELQNSINQILKIVTWLIIPTSALLLYSQLQAEQSVPDAIVGAVAGVVAMVPQGLVLLVSVSLAAAVVRLGGNKVLVQELPAVETLARVDIVCVDKTGTLTSGDIVFDQYVQIDGSTFDAAAVLSATAASDPDPNATMHALLRAFPADTQPDVVSRLPFSSERKTSAVAFGDGTAWTLGAPEFVLDAHTRTLLAEQIGEFTRQGNRVLVMCRTTPESVADGIAAPGAPAMLLVFSEDVRPDAAETVAYFEGQGVTVKVISGDASDTVAAVAAQVGVTAQHVVDATTLPDPSDTSFDSIAEETGVFGRVNPEQKRDLVTALQRNGHVVAMTGDGVNDVLAVKQADLGIAMGAGTGATHAVAQIVLMDNRFASLPQVVAEGRRVVANMERVASLFLTKTVYATMLAVFIGFVGLAFPFLPRHMTLVGALTIGIPAFILSFENQERPIRKGFMARVLSFAVPAGLVSGVTVFGFYALSRIERLSFSLEQSRTGTTILMIVLGLVILAELVSPVSKRNVVMIAAMFAGLLIVLAVPQLRNLFELALPGFGAWIVIGIVAGVAGAILRRLLRTTRRSVERRFASVGL
jgi:cation-transporting ATPase E